MRSLKTSNHAMLRIFIYTVFLAISSLLISCSQSSPQDNNTKLNNPPVALVYYSTSLSQEIIGGGNSHFLSIDKDGSIQTRNGDGLEWNAPVQLQDSNRIVIQAREKVHVQQGKGIEDTYSSRCRVSAGYRQMSGYLTSSKLYYALFNKGIDTHDNYISTIRWGDAQHHNCADIPEFVEAQGSDENHIYVLTSDHASLQGLNLVVMELEGSKLQQTKYPLLDIYTGSLIVQSKMVSTQNNMYVVFSTRDEHNRIHLQLMEIDKSTHTATTYSLHTYGEEPDNAYFSLSANSIGIVDKMLYYVDGYGTIFSFSLDTKASVKSNTLAKFHRTSNLNDAMGYVYGTFYYLFRYDESDQIHKIEQYQLSDGKLLKKLLIPNLASKLSSGVYLYDFQMLTNL